MAAVRSIYSKAGLFSGKGRVGVVQDVLKPLFGSSRPMATEAAFNHVRIIPAEPPAPVPFAIRKAPTVLATLHEFPSMEPARFEQFPSTFLHAPLRRDILHKAIVYEGDAHRWGRAKVKTRGDVHGSSRKIRPQKGTGKARLGDKKSPMLRGGGVAHGPHPRDFSSDLPRKIYDLAWRTALSYRYRRGELFVVGNELEIGLPDAGLAAAIFKVHDWGHDASRSLLITAELRPNMEDAMKVLGAEGRVLTADQVDVKDLLETGRVIIEREALAWFEQEHGIDAA